MSNTPDYITPDGEELFHHELEDLYAEWLDEVYGEVDIAGLTYYPSTILREVDPIAFRVGVSDYVDARMSDDEDLDEWREDHPWREVEVEWTEHRDDIFGRVFGRFTATRQDGTELQVSESGTSTAEHPVWDIFVQSASGCCEYLAELEATAMEAMIRAEEVNLYVDATATDEEDCPNCKL